MERGPTVVYESLHPSFDVGLAPFCADPNDVQTQVDGLRKRLCAQTPLNINDPDVREAYLRRLKPFRRFVQAWLDKHYTPLDVVPDFEEWIEHTSYNGARREQLRQMHRSLNGGTPSAAASSRVSAFVKREFYMAYKHARWICSRSDEFKAYWGPACHAIEQRLFAMPYFAKSFKAPGSLVNHISQAPRGHTIATDFTAFECHFSKIFLEHCEFLLYRHALRKADPARANFVCRVLGGVNRISTRAGVRLKLDAGRMSGDMNTSLGNSFSNLMLLLYAAHVAGDDNPWALVEGDDGLLVSATPVDEQLFADLNFTIKLERVDDACEASFCGKIFGRDKQVVRDPKKFFISMAFSDNAVGVKHRRRSGLLRAKALSAAFETPHCPVVRAIADWAIRETHGSKAVWTPDGYHVTPVGRAPIFAPSADTRALFERQYGITAEHQLELEARVAQGDFTCLTALFGAEASAFAYISAVG